MRKFIYLAVGLSMITASIFSVNYWFVGAALSDAIESDSRNVGVEASAHYENYIFPSVLVFDLRKVSGTNSPADVFRIFLQFSFRVKDKSFERVQLAHNGIVKFQIRGDFFQKLGREFEQQNPIYTIRTFPENVHRPDGTPAFGTWTGGMLGVLSQQMKDFNKFHQEWYINDIVAATAAQKEIK